MLLLQLALQVCNAAGLLCKLQLLGAACVVAAFQLQLTCNRVEFGTETAEMDQH
jgi:hypothetical protein